MQGRLQAGRIDFRTRCEEGWRRGEEISFEHELCKLGPLDFVQPLLAVVQCADNEEEKYPIAFLKSNSV
jgi:hypothetical protein